MLSIRLPWSLERSHFNVKIFWTFNCIFILFSFFILFLNGELILINCHFINVCKSAIYAIYVTCFVLTKFFYTIYAFEFLLIQRSKEQKLYLVYQIFDLHPQANPCIHMHPWCHEFIFAQGCYCCMKLLLLHKVVFITFWECLQGFYKASKICHKVVMAMDLSSLAMLDCQKKG